jgi:hypothetical protein
MSVRQDCIPLEARADWEEALSPVSHTFPATWASCHAMYLTSGYATYLYRLECNGTIVVCPFAERTFRGHTDIVTPYGISGFSGTGPCPDFVEIWRDFAISRGYVCGYIGQHPMFFDPSYCLNNEIYEYSNIYVFDLTMSIGELFARLSKGRKAELKHWSSGEISRDTNRLKAFFLDHYQDFMRSRKAARINYHSPEALSFLLDQENVLMAGMPAVGPVKAVSVFTCTNDIGHYLFNISTPDAHSYTTPLIWHAVHELKSRGITRLDLGGGVTPNDGVALYKKHFNAVSVPLFSIRQVYQPDIYNRLSADTGQDADDMSGYFPAYHKP